jgi:HlyD family secretion protein
MLERNQLLAQQSAVEARATEAGKQSGALLVQHEIAKRSYDRVRRLFVQQAATAQQLDQAEREYRVLGEQLEASRALRRSTREEITSSEARVAQIGERLRKSRITNPVTGTVLVAYMKQGETVQQGQPLYKIANLDSMLLRAYITETQLSGVRIGQRVRVSMDAGEGTRTISGTVTWVSSQSEFTPTPIQTRDERASLVYAVKIRVPNVNGSIKIGMPADVRFIAQTAAK